MTSTDADQASQAAPKAVPERDDEFLWGFPAFAFCSVLVLLTLSYLERIAGGILIVAFLLFGLLGLLMLIFALLGVFDLLRGNFKRSSAFLLCPLIFVSPFVMPTWGITDDLLDLIRFYYDRPHYTAIIDQLPPAERASRLVLFNWGTTGLAVTATSEYWLVYDESGEIVLPDEGRSQAWKDKANRENWSFKDEKCMTRARRLSGHYYSAGIHCPY